MAVRRVGRTLGVPWPGADKGRRMLHGSEGLTSSEHAFVLCVVIHVARIGVDCARAAGRWYPLVPDSGL